MKWHFNYLGRNMPLQKKRCSPEEALIKVRSFCNYRERCHAEVREKLYDLGLYKKEVELLITQMIDENLLNEERYAQSFARGYFRTKRWGKVKIVMALKARSINDRLISDALKEIDEQEYQQTMAHLAQRKLETLKTAAPTQKRVKLSNYLVSKGYAYSDFSDLLNKVLKP